jgi:predicted aminopeptidase
LSAKAYRKRVADAGNEELKQRRAVHAPRTRQQQTRELEAPDASVRRTQAQAKSGGQVLVVFVGLVLQSERYPEVHGTEALLFRNHIPEHAFQFLENGK